MLATASPHPRATRLSALVSVDEGAAIASRAEAAGLSVSAYLRERALGDDEDALRQVDMIIAEMEAALDRCPGAHADDGAGMSDWFDRIARLAALSERMTVLTDGVRSLAGKVEDHQTRLVRLETIIEITRPDGGTLRIAADKNGK